MFDSDLILSICESMNAFNSFFMDSPFFSITLIHSSGTLFNVPLSKILIFPSKSRNASAILVLITLFTISSKRLSTLFVSAHLLSQRILIIYAFNVIPFCLASSFNFLCNSSGSLIVVTILNPHFHFDMKII